MTPDIAAASRFMTAHARLLDRLRFALLLGETEPDAVLAALEPYRNADGGYGWGLEPDLRAAESQPAGALHAFEVFEDVAPHAAPRAVELCDWLLGASLPDGGLPFALPVADTTATAPFWAGADASVSSLQITAAVTAAAHRVARHDPAVAAHPWLDRATQFCLDAIEALDAAAHAYELLFAIGLLDAVHGVAAEAPAELERLGALIPPGGSLPVASGAPEERLRPLDFAPFPGRPARGVLPAEAVRADLDRLASGQAADGGWTVDFASYSPAATLEWRGYATVRSVRILGSNGRLA